MTIRWRGRDPEPKEQVANAWGSFVDLTPASDVPAQGIKDNWSALRAGQDVPLIGESDGIQPDQDDPDQFWSR